MVEFWNRREVEKILDLLEEGIIVLDGAGYIQLYNRKARDIFGINRLEGHGHPGGQILPGDWILFADNWLGRDDGGLTPHDLMKIGVELLDLETGMGVVAIGQFGSRQGSAVAKGSKLKDLHQKKLQVQREVNGHKLVASIDHRQRQLLLGIDGQSIPYNYYFAAGHLVILDRETMQVKFYQTRGYTARGEAAKEILGEKYYLEKGANAIGMEVLGQHFSAIHSSSGDGDKLVEALNQGISFHKLELEINGVTALCSTVPLQVDGEQKGAVLVFEDISELKSTMEERDSALANLEKLTEQVQTQKRVSEAFEHLIGRSKSISETIRLAQRGASSNSTMLLLGESGTGKGLIAKAVHDASRRSTGPFISINCASIPETLLESELFGYDSGAFTGAKKEGKPGKFELADGGTIFLDEIGDLPLSMQAKLLHVLQEKKIQRLGSTVTKEIDLRIIAATNRDLEMMVQTGDFREDLYYRIHVIAIRIPPLCERKEDIPDLIHYLLPKICQRVGVGLKAVSPEVVQYLCQYHWPGNVRELENVLEMVVSLSSDKVITSEVLPKRITHGLEIVGDKVLKLEKLAPLQQLLDECEELAIKEALRESNGNRTKAIEILQIGRTQFYQKLKKYQLDS